MKRHFLHPITLTLDPLSNPTPRTNKQCQLPSLMLCTEPLRRITPTPNRTPKTSEASWHLTYSTIYEHSCAKRGLCKNARSKLWLDSSTFRDNSSVKAPFQGLAPIKCRWWPTCWQWLMSLSVDGCLWLPGPSGTAGGAGGGDGSPECGAAANLLLIKLMPALPWETFVKQHVNLSPTLSNSSSTFNFIRVKVEWAWKKLSKLGRRYRYRILPTLPTLPG